MMVVCAAVLAACAGAGNDVDWRVLADERGVGGDPAVYVAKSDAEYHAVWSDLGFNADRPSVDMDEEVVVAFTVQYASGCEFPFVALDIDHTTGTISPRYAGNEPGQCGDDEKPYTVSLAIRRDALTADSYHVHLTAVPQDVVQATAVELHPNG